MPGGPWQSSTPGLHRTNLQDIIDIDLTSLLNTTAHTTYNFLHSSQPYTTTSLNLFGGKKDKDAAAGGGGPMGGMGNMMEQFKKAQEIAKRTQQMQEEVRLRIRHLITRPRLCCEAATQGVVPLKRSEETSQHLLSLSASTRVPLTCRFAPQS